MKGGGSISGKLWNNREKPLVGTIPVRGAYDVDGYPLKMKRFEVHPGFGDQGETFTGYIKRRDFNRDYVHNPATSKEALRKKRPSASTFDTDGLQVKIQRPEYIEHKNSADEALLKLRPSKTTSQAGELQIKLKQQEYGKKPHAAEGALEGIKPSRSTVRASEYSPIIGNRKSRQTVISKVLDQTRSCCDVYQSTHFRYCHHSCCCAV